jgi:hypothetical protein
MTVTLPTPGRLLFALAMIAVAFVVALAIGQSNRPPAPRVGPPPPQRIAATVPSQTVTVPAPAPPLPALKVLKPRLRVLSVKRSRRVV